MASSQQIAQTRFTKLNLSTALESATDRSRFLKDWSAELSSGDQAHDCVVQEHETEYKFELADEIIGSEHLLTVACETWQQDSILKARLSDVSNRIILHQTLLKKLHAQTTANDREIFNAELMLMLLEGQRRQCEEELQQTRLVQHSLSDLEISERTCEINLSDVDESAIQVILASAQESNQQAMQRRMNAERSAEHSAQRIKALRELAARGFASRDEILSLQIRIAELQSLIEKSGEDMRKAEIDGQLAEAAFQLARQRPAAMTEASRQDQPQRSANSE